jgi:hypothetical protein
MDQETIDLRQYRPRQHPLRDRFRGRIPYTVLAGFVGVSASRINQIFNGQTGMPAKHEKRLRELAQALDEGRVVV